MCTGRQNQTVTWAIRANVNHRIGSLKPDIVGEYGERSRFSRVQLSLSFDSSRGIAYRLSSLTE